MTANSLVKQAAFNRRKATPNQLVENRTVYERHGADLSIYDTFAMAEKVKLDAEEVLYCGMISGKKVLHGKQHFNANFMPHESFLMAPGETVEIDFPEATLENPTSCLTLAISRERLQLECDKLNKNNPKPKELGEWTPKDDQVLHVYHTEATQQLLVRIVDSFLCGDDDRDLVLDLGVTELLTRMLRKKSKDFLLQCVDNDPSVNGLTAVLRYMEDNLAEAIDIEKLCKLACMSRSKLYQEFSGLLGLGPAQYVQLRRLEKARDLIAAGCSITAACYEVGYVNPSHFTRRFHQQFGLSPRQFAQTNRH